MIEAVMDCSIFQSDLWGEFKTKTGYQKYHRVSDILVLEKKLPFGRTMLYAPLVQQEQVSKIEEPNFLEQINKIAKKENSAFFRLELNLPSNLQPWPLALGFVKSFEEMQPENNWLLDISQSEEKILAEMKPKGRYNIKIAEKNNLTISSSDKKGRELEAFYQQYSSTGKRHGITYRSKRYFEALLEILGEKDYARAYVIWKDQTALASAIVIFSGNAALYLYGGSSDQYRNMMAPYLLHWEIIKEAKKRGLTEYNFLGIAPNEDKNHPWSGITRFKKQFGGFQCDTLGSFDLPIKPLEYRIFKLAEKIRRR